MKQPKDNLKRLLSYTKQYWKQLVISGVCASLFGLFSAAPSYLVQHTVDQVFVARMQHLLIPFIIGFLALFALKGLFMYLSNYYMNWVGNRVVNDVRHDLFGTAIYFPTSFFQEKTTGGLMSHFLNDITLIQNASSSAVRNGMRSICEATFLLAVAFLQSWKLSLLMLVVGPLIALAITRMGSAVRQTSRQAQTEMGKVSSLLQEMLSGIREIKAFNTERVEIRRFKNYLQNYFVTIMECIHFESLAPAIIEIIAMSGIGFVLYVAALQVLNGSMTPGQLTSFFAAVLLAYQPIKRLVNVYAEVQYALGSADRVFDIMDSVFPTSQGRTIQIKHFEQAISFKNCTFSYHQDQPVLDAINLELKRGENIGIIGPSGSGKSTMCDLLMGFLTPTGGTITIDGHDITKLSFASLREQIGYVGQQPFLFNDTVLANVAYAKPGAIQEDVERACRAAHAHEFIQKLPKGYLTMVGENGTLLSGGQKQRLTIARALLKNPPILIFDEATSALDQTSENLIRQAIDEIGHKKTMIIISHRLTFIEKMDRIYNIHQGRLIPVEKSTLNSQNQQMANFF